MSQQQKSDDRNKDKKKPVPLKAASASKPTSKGSSKTEPPSVTGSKRPSTLGQATSAISISGNVSKGQHVSDSGKKPRKLEIRPKDSTANAASSVPIKSEAKPNKTMVLASKSEGKAPAKAPGISDSREGKATFVARTQAVPTNRPMIQVARTDPDEFNRSRSNLRTNENALRGIFPEADRPVIQAPLLQQTKSRSEGDKSPSWDSLETRETSLTLGNPDNRPGVKYKDGRMRYAKKAPFTGPNIVQLFDVNGFKRQVLEIGEGQGHMFRYTTRLLEDNGRYRTVPTDKPDFKIHSSIRHLDEFAKDGGQVAFVGTSNCITCTGVYFELTGSRVFCAHILVKLHEYPQTRPDDLSANDHTDIKELIYARLKAHSDKYGWKPEDIDIDSLRMVCPRPDVTAPSVARGVATFLGQNQVEAEKIKTRVLIPGHGFIMFPGAIRSGGQRAPRKYCGTQSVPTSKGFMFDINEDYPNGFRGLDYAKAGTKTQWMYIGPQKGWQAPFD